MSSDITPQISDKRRSFSPAFKMNIAKLALAGELSVSVIARQNDINTNQVFRWTREFQRQQVYWVKQALHLPSSGSEPKLLPVKIQNSLLPVSEVSVDDCVFRFVRPPVPVSSGQAFRCDPASMI